jgi:hypothetical protein
VSYPRRILVAWLLIFVLVPATRAADPPGMGIGNQMTDMFDTMLRPPDLRDYVLTPIFGKAPSNTMNSQRPRINHSHAIS